MPGISAVFQPGTEQPSPGGRLQLAVGRSTCCSATRRISTALKARPY